MSSARNDQAAASGDASKPAIGTRVWRSLGVRLAFWYVAVTLSSFLAVAVFFLLHTRMRVQRAGEATAQNVLERYRVALESGGVEALRALINQARGPQPGVVVHVRDENQVELVTLASDENSSRVAPVLRPKSGTSRAETGVPSDWHVAIARVSKGRELQVLIHDAGAVQAWHNAAGVLWLILCGGLVTAIGGAFVISRHALRPLNELARTTQNIIASGDLGSRVSVRGSHDDLDQLGELFNRMLARNEALVRAMKESLDNVAHDLRTPITRLRTGAELALRGPIDPSKATEALSDVIEETDRVLSLLTTLMDITQASTGVMRLDKHVEDLGSIAREAVELYEFVSAERGVHVLTRLSPGVEVVVDRRRCVQVCANLLDNAIKYTPAGGSVEVSVTSNELRGIITVADTGIGIAPEDRARVWERLFRGDRSRAERGLGLGLSLVKAVVEAHGGEIRLRPDTPTGATFDVFLPLAKGMIENR